MTKFETYFEYQDRREAEDKAAGKKIGQDDDIYYYRILFDYVNYLSEEVKLLRQQKNN